MRENRNMKMEAKVEIESEDANKTSIDKALLINAENMSCVEKEFLDLWAQFDKVVKQKFAQARYTSTIVKTLRNANVEGINYFRLEELQRKHIALCGNQKGSIISPEDIQYLHQIIDIVGALTTAYSDCIKIDDAFTCQFKDSVKSVVEVMDQKEYSRVPIIDNNNKLVGIFSEATRLELLGRQIGISDELTFKAIEDLVVVKAYEQLAVCRNEKFLFVAEGLSRYELQKLIGSPKTKGDMVFVTEHGESSEPILGILTVRDIHDLSCPSKSKTT